MMLKLTGPLAAALVLGCGEGRSVVTDGGAAAQPDLFGATCSCTPTGTTNVTGTLDGAPVTFFDAAYGVMATWGSHADPITPCAVTGLEVVLRPKPPDDCAKDGQPLELSAYVSDKPGKKSFTDYINLASGRTRVSGWLCLTYLPFASGAYLGCASEGLGAVKGCADLEIRTDKEVVIGRISGPVEASHCSSLNIAGGE